MKKLKCPKCNSFITFDETKYETNQKLIFKCPKCYNKFGIRLGNSFSQDKINSLTSTDNCIYGYLCVIENCFHYKQIIPLHEGLNIIGRFHKGNNINCPIKTVDPSIDYNHCSINVIKDKENHFKYILKDGPSNTGTFVSNQLLEDNEQRIIDHKTLFTIGATSIIIYTK